MHYNVTAYNNTHLDVTNEYREMLGTLEYTFWLPKRAHITLADNTVYNIDPTGFWLNTMEVTKNGEGYAVIKYNWPGSYLEVSFSNNASFIFRRKNILNGTYVAEDIDGNEIARLQTVFTWKLLGFNYEVDVQDNYADEETTLLLPFLLTYCARHLRIPHSMGTV